MFDTSFRVLKEKKMVGIAANQSGCVTQKQTNMLEDSGISNEQKLKNLINTQCPLDYSLKKWLSSQGINRVAVLFVD